MLLNKYHTWNEKRKAAKDVLSKQYRNPILDGCITWCTQAGRRARSVTTPEMRSSAGALKIRFHLMSGCVAHQKLAT
jgi:hypothetical protein